MNLIPSYFIITFVTIISFIQKSHQKLLFVYEHIRHGTRGPGFGEQNTNIINTDFFNTSWKGNGEITNIGLRMIYILGQLHRQKYGSFLKSITEPTEIMVLSSPKRRTIMSAYALLKGMFPNTKDKLITSTELTKTLPPIKLSNELNEYINQQEHFPIPHQETLIPVHIMDHYENKVLLTDESVCAKMKSYKQISMQNSLLQQSFQKLNETYGKQIIKYFKLDNNNRTLFTIENTIRLCDVFVVNYDNNKDLSSFENAGINLKTFYSLSLELLNNYLFTGECTEEISLLALSVTIPKILKWMQTHIDLDIKNKISVINKHAYPKYVIYSAHDKTLAPFQLFMKHIFGSKLIYPSFGSNLFFELHRNDSSLNRNGEKDDYYVRYYFNDELLLEEKFEVFKKRINDMLWSKEYIRDFCTVIKDLNYAKGIIVLIGIVFIGVSLIFVKMKMIEGKEEKTRKRLRKYSNHIDEVYKGMPEKMEELVNIK
jgi:hypothetical protein